MTGQEKYKQLLVLAADMAAEFESACVGEELNRTEVAMLSLIGRAELIDDKVISTQIAKELNITRSAVSQTVDRLVEKGHVRREASPYDKKIAYIVLTEEYRDGIKGKIEENISLTESVLQEMGERDAETFLLSVRRFYSLREKVKKEK